MKKVTAFIGSTQKRGTYQAILEFEKNLKQYGEIDFEIVFLNEYYLEFCKGCSKLCFDRGEEYCPCKDDRDLLLEKMEQSEGVIFATPNYAFQVSARMKNFLDRIAFVIHRPRFFGKTFTAVVTQGFFRGNAIRKYLEFNGANLGFSVTKGSCLQTLIPITELQQKKLEQEMKKSSERFYKGLSCLKPAVPTFFRLMLFRMSRTGIQSASERYYDYFYYKDKGWFESDFYYETNLGPIKKLAGHFFDFIGRQIGKRM